MLTDFGRFCRGVRINNNELLYYMAQKLGTTSAYLSGVENGKDTPPKEWEQKIKAHYVLTEDERKQLHEFFREV